MSTKSTIASAQQGDLNVHLYHEQHDNCVHLLLSGTSYSRLDIVVAPWMVRDLGQVIEPGSFSTIQADKWANTLAHIPPDFSLDEAPTA